MTSKTDRCQSWRRTPARAFPRRALAGLVLALAAGACRQDMHNQPRAKPLAESDFFENGGAARMPVRGTVARGHLRDDKVLNTGIGPDGKFVARMPVPLTRALLLRGRERFDVFCSPCHDRVGGGKGMIVQRGFKAPTSYHLERVRLQPIGYYFDVITNGFGEMSSYASQIPAEDRWAIAAHIRVLQLAQRAPVGDLSQADQQALAEAGRAPSGAAPAPGSEGHR